MKNGSVEPRQAAAIGADPDIALVILLNATDEIAAQTIGGREMKDWSVGPKTKEAVAIGPHPHLARAGFGNSHDHRLGARHSPGLFFPLVVRKSPKMVVDQHPTTSETALAQSGHTEAFLLRLIPRRHELAFAIYS